MADEPRSHCSNWAAWRRAPGVAQVLGARDWDRETEGRRGIFAHRNWREVGVAAASMGLLKRRLGIILAFQPFLAVPAPVASQHPS